MHFRLLLSATAILLGIASGAPASDATPLRATTNAPESSDDSIGRLIAQLGSEDFTERREAEAELVQLGTAAFDYLQAARSHSDLEIATQAQYLLHRVPIDWVRDYDHAEVRDLMAPYAAATARQRREIVTRLAALDDAAGVAALSRIAHYDMSQITAKYAALGVLNNHRQLRQQSSVQVVQSIAAEIGESSRDSSRWLRLLASQLQNVDLADSRWSSLVADEAAQLGGEERTTSSRLVLGLLQFHVNLCHGLADDRALLEALKSKIDFLNSQARTSDAMATRVISRMLDRQDMSALDGGALRYSSWISNDVLLDYVLNSDRPETFTSLALVLSWVLDNQAWGVLPLLEKEFEKEIKADRLLLYMIAASRAAQDRFADAQDLANRAYQLVARDVEERNKTGDVIADMGHHDWAEREWQFVVDQMPITSVESMIARRSIANWCLHDRGEDKAAADLLGEVCDEVDTNPDAKRTVLGDDVARLYLKALRTQREYFLACHLEREGDYAAQQRHLESAYRLDHEDPDVLIAMYRLKEADAEYRRRVAGRIRRVADNIEQRIESDPEESRWYNHYSWLVSNTEGDFQKAVRYSLKSVELCPNTPSYLDTLGRCYYAAGDLENAIKYQRQAVELHPKVNILRKQLETFEKALSEQSQ